MGSNLPFLARVTRSVLAAGFFIAVGGVGRAQVAPVENSVVKIFSTVRYPDYYRP